MRIYFATSNQNKFAEAREILGSMVIKAPMAIDEIQSVEVGKVALHKLAIAYGRLGKPTLVEDTGLYLRALGGFPGALVKHMEARIGAQGLARLVFKYADASAVAETVVGFRDGKTTKVITSRTKGSIVRKPRGTNGFGFDSIFVPEGAKKTFAQMSIIEKNGFSARGKSLKKLARFLKTL